MQPLKCLCYLIHALLLPYPFSSQHIEFYGLKYLSVLWHKKKCLGRKGPRVHPSYVTLPVDMILWIFIFPPLRGIITQRIWFQTLGSIHKLHWQVFGLFWPPIPLRWHFLPYKRWQKQIISGLKALHSKASGWLMQILHYFEPCSASWLDKNSNQSKICISQPDALEWIAFTYPSPLVNVVCERPLMESTQKRSNAL